jgi:hypothetical protein
MDDTAKDNAPKKVSKSKIVIRINPQSAQSATNDEDVNISSIRNPDRISMTGAPDGLVASYQITGGGSGGGSATEVVTLSSDDDPVVCLSDTSVSDIGMTTQTKINNNNPFETHNICIPFIDETYTDRADIYLLRYQTPQELLLKIERNYDGVLEKIRQMFIRKGKFSSMETLDLVRLGYFALSYDDSPSDLDKRLKVGIVTNPSKTVPGFQSVHTSFTSLPWLEYEEFEELFYSPSQFASSSDMNSDESSSISSGESIDDFEKLFEGLIEKTMYEMFIRKNLNTDSSFEQLISIDLYPNRSKGSANIFHLDATHQMDVNFFTLTYFLPYDVKIKGPTVVTKTELPVRNQVTLLVKNGTTIGIDNDVVLHSTSDPIVRVLPEKLEDLPIPQGNYHGDFYLHTEPKEGMPDDARESTRSIEQMTRENDRKFARTWYIRTVMEDDIVGIDGKNFQLMPCSVDISYLKHMINRFRRKTNIIVVEDVTDPNFIIGLEAVQKNSLGGGVERGNALYSALPSSIPSSIPSFISLEKDTVNFNDNYNKNFANSKSSYNDEIVSEPQSVSNNAPENFTQLFNDLLSENFIIRQSGKVIYSKKPIKGGKKHKKTKKVKKSSKSRKGRKSRNSRKSRKGRKTRKYKN